MWLSDDTFVFSVPLVVNELLTCKQTAKSGWNKKNKKRSVAQEDMTDIFDVTPDDKKPFFPIFVLNLFTCT